MINQSSILATRGVVNDLTSAGYTLEIRPGSVLESLINSTELENVIVDNPDMVSIKDIKNDEEALLRMSRLSTAVSGALNHTNEMDAAIELVARIVNSSINHARNVVNPVIVKLTEELTQVSADFLNQSSDVYLTRVAIDPIFKNEYLLEKLSTLVAGEKPKYDRDATRDCLADLSIDELRKAMSTGLPQLDNAITSLNNATGAVDEFLEMVSTTAHIEITETEIVNNREIHSDHSNLLRYLLLDGIINGRLPAAKADSVEEHKLWLIQARSYIGLTVERQINYLNANIKGDKILLPRFTNTDSQSIAIDAAAFTAWQKRFESVGVGALEVLYCYHNGSSIPMNADEVDAVKLLKERAATWDKGRERSRNAKVESEVSRAAAKAVITMIKERAADPESGEVKETFELTRAASDWIKNHPYRVGGKMIDWVRRLVCEAYEPNADCYRILTLIEQGIADHADDEEFGLGEAVEYAKIELIAEWYAAQFVVTNAE